MKYGDTNSNVDWKEVFVENFMSSIQYHKIPANVLMNEVEPLKLVPYEVIMTSLAYQVRNKFQYDLTIIFFPFFFTDKTLNNHNFSSLYVNECSRCYCSRQTPPVSIPTN